MAEGDFIDTGEGHGVGVVSVQSGDESELAHWRKECGYPLNCMGYEAMARAYNREKRLHDRLGMRVVDPWTHSWGEPVVVFMVRFKGSKRVEAIIAAHDNKELWDIIDQWTDPWGCQVREVTSGGVWFEDVAYNEEEGEWSGFAEEWLDSMSKRDSWRPAVMYDDLGVFEKMLPLLARMERRLMRGLAGLIGKLEEKVRENGRTARQAVDPVGQDGTR